jgi:hypothetical protein
MSWREHIWEFAISALSWVVAVGALVFVVAFVAYDAAKTRHRRRKGLS